MTAEKRSFDWNSVISITAIITLIAGAVYHVRQGDIESIAKTEAKLEAHEAKEGHPRLVEKSNHTRELLELKIASLEQAIKDLGVSIREDIGRLEKEIAKMSACMERFEHSHSNAGSNVTPPAQH